MDKIKSARINKASLTVVSGFDEATDRTYWHSKSPIQRLEALELMSHIIYGYDPSSDRLQRILTVAERS